jgi:acyl-CoA dehydrogenase
MFFGDAHRALGEELAKKLEGTDDALHAVDEVASRMGELGLGLYDVLVPRTLGGRDLSDEGAERGAGARPARSEPSEDRVDVRALCVLREALAYVSPLADSVFAVQGLGSYPLVLAASFRRRAELLRDVVSGKRIAGFALTEPEAGSDVASMRTTARRERGESDGWVLDGEKVFISNVGIANHFIVFANADPAAGKRGISAFFVEADAPGLTLEPIATAVDHPLGRLVMDSCRVPHDALIGDVGHGMRLALGTLDVFRTSVGAAAVGMAQRALDETVRRVTTRVQFGQPLSDFQLTQAALADMATDVDAARLLVCRAAWLKDRGAKATGEIAMAKMFATEAAQRVIDRAVQLHGGLGVVSGSIVERLYREVRPLRIYEGTTEIQKLILGSTLVRQSKEFDQSGEGREGGES